MQRLSYRTQTVSSNKIIRNRIVLSFKDSPKKPLGRRPIPVIPVAETPIIMSWVTLAALIPYNGSFEAVSRYPASALSLVSPGIVWL